MAAPVSNTGPFGIPPGGPWFAFTATGTIQRQSDPVAAAALANAGWVGFATQDDAKAFLGSRAVPPITSVAGDAVGAVSSTAQGIAKIGAFLEALTHPDTWRSLGWLILGIILVALGMYVWLKGHGVVPNVVPVPV